MWTTRITLRTLAGITLMAGPVAPMALGQGKPEDLLARRPVQPGVAITTPTGADAAGCKAEPVSWPKPANGPAPTGIVVKDAAGRIVRQFIDTAGRNDPTKFTVWSYFHNGVEAYREVDGNQNGKVDQYRWFGANGWKWGIDVDEDGIVDTWYVISAEELGQELFQAMMTKDAKRLSALLPSKEDLKSLGLPDAEIAKLLQRGSGAVARMQETAAALKLTDKAKWVHTESGAPTATPKESFGGVDDLVRNQTVSVLVDKGDGKNADVFQTGELILIGRAWKLIDGPQAGPASPQTPVGGASDVIVVDAAIQPLVAELDKAKTPAERAPILEKIVEKTKGEAQQPWLKQVIDAYATAAEAGDKSAMTRLQQWVTAIDGSAAKSPAAAYAAFRYASADYAIRLGGAKNQDDLGKVQTWWREQLEAFVTKHSTSEEAPEAMLRLAVAHEFAGKDGEALAKTWYERIAKDHPNHTYAAKATGSVRRLTSEGQPFMLNGQTLDGKPFASTQMAGKAVIVYYWASWGQGAVAELKLLADLQKAYGPKGLEIVTISLDDDAAKAVAAINAAQLPGTHLFAPGGLDRSPLGTAYGIQMVPHAFLIGKDGKVANRNAQTGPTMKDDVEKLLK